MTGYALGIDLGTSFTTAAVARQAAEMIGLGNHAPAMPSAVYLREDGEFLVGEVAVRRGIDDPSRMAREFKRRMGDQTPILLAHTPYSAERLMAAVLRHVVREATERFGGRPSSIALAHPANWGAYKTDLLRHAVQLAGIPEARLVTEPEAAAVHFASGERVEPGEMVAVYDLGGGTFDAAVLRRTDDGFETLGTPHGIERLGGMDFDDAVVSHVMSMLDESVDRTSDDPNLRSALARLRAECVAAKEALSADTDATIPVVLPGVHTQIRITRPEFESTIRPLVTETIAVLRQAIESAGITPDALKAVVLAGGSSRIPLVAEMVRSELGRPVALDAHPKHTVALGAAMIARHALEAGQVTTPESATTPAPAAPHPTPASPAPQPAPSAGRRPLWPLVAAGAVLLAGLGLGAALVLGGDDGSETTAATEPVTGSTDGPTVAPTVPPGETTTPVPTTDPPPPVEACTATSGRCAFVDSITLGDDGYVVAYTTVGFEPQIDGGPESHHVHFFFDTVPLEQAGVPGTGPWVVWDLDEAGRKLFHGEEGFGPDEVPPGATAICVTVAEVGHQVEAGALADCEPLP